jgi:hypothetical protein
MDKDFPLEYSKRSDDELLRLATERASLTARADAALTDELRRRNLKESDQAKHQRSVRRHDQLESKKRRRRIFGRLTDGRAWIDVLLALLVIFLISAAYRQLPSQYHFKPDWEEAAANVMWPSVIIAVCGFSWRTITFWVSLAVSSCIHLVVVHAWIRQVGTLSLIQSKQAFSLGFVLFLVLYFLFWVLRQKFFREEARDNK